MAEKNIDELEVRHERIEHLCRVIRALAEDDRGYLAQVNERVQADVDAIIAERNRLRRVAEASERTELRELEAVLGRMGVNYEEKGVGGLGKTVIVGSVRFEFDHRGQLRKWRFAYWSRSERCFTRNADGTTSPEKD